MKGIAGLASIAADEGIMACPKDILSEESRHRAAKVYCIDGHPGAMRKRVGPSVYGPGSGFGPGSALGLLLSRALSSDQAIRI